MVAQWPHQFSNSRWHYWGWHLRVSRKFLEKSRFKQLGFSRNPEIPSLLNSNRPSRFCESLPYTNRSPKIKLARKRSSPEQVRNNRLIYKVALAVTSSASFQNCGHTACTRQIFFPVLSTTMSTEKFTRIEGGTTESWHPIRSTQFKICKLCRTDTETIGRMQSPWPNVVISTEKLAENTEAGRLRMS